MAFQGGDFIEVTYNHPTLGGGTFFLKAGEDVTLNDGGFRVEDDMGAIAGNGEIIKKSNRMRWAVEGPVAWNMTTTNELRVLSDLAGDPVDADWTFTHQNTQIWVGVGTVVGDIPGSGQDATIPVKISGGGRLTKIT